MYKTSDLSIVKNGSPTKSHNISGGYKITAFLDIFLKCNVSRKKMKLIVVYMMKDVRNKLLQEFL